MHDGLVGQICSVRSQNFSLKVSRSRRYDLGFWGRAGGRRKPGRRAAADEAARAAAEGESAMEQMRLDNQRDLERCRSLLVEMGEEDLRQLLMRSRFNFGGSVVDITQRMSENTALDDKWLEEAAAAFHVATRLKKMAASSSDTRTRSARKQSDVVEDVLSAVRRARESLHGAAADRDAKRRHQLLEAMHDPVGLSAAVKSCHARREKNEAVSIVKDRVLLRSCPEDLRLAMVTEFVEQHGRLPSEDVEAERAARQYVDSALGRRWLTTATGEHLSARQVSAWDKLFEQVPEGDRPPWEEDPVFLLGQAFYNTYGHIRVPKAKSYDTSAEAQLSRGLALLRKALHADQYDKNGQLLRRQLAAQDAAKWEAACPGVWEVVRERGLYLPPEHVLGERHVWPREPFLCKPCGCYLCGEDFETKPELVDHWASSHICPPDDMAESLDPQRAEEEVRKRLFWEESMHGPFEVCGQEHRRTVGAYATHQTHSFPGTGGMNYNKKSEATSRQLSGCAICARSMWLEDAWPGFWIYRVFSKYFMLLCFYA